MKHLILVLFITLILTSCGSVPVKSTDAGEKVEVTDYIKPGDREKLKELDQVKCKLGANMRSRVANIEGCQNELRNKTAELGGDLVLVQNLDGSRYELGTANKLLVGGSCENCVELKGIAYKRK